jgi:hypothetical protein
LFLTINDGIIICEIKSRIAMAKAAFNKKRVYEDGTGRVYETLAFKLQTPGNNPKVNI